MMKRYFIVALVAIGLSGCVTPPQRSDYSSFRSENPRSILVLPALNNTLNVEAPDYFLSTLSQPFAERGYYVFPAHMVKRTLEENGLSDANLIYEADTERVGRLFGCDAALYVTIDRWDSQYVILATQTTVEFNYEMRSCETGETLWSDRQQFAYSPQASSSGNILVDVVAMAVVAAIEKAAPNYMPLARQANLAASATPGRGIPAGPYRPESYRSDQAEF